MPKILGFRPSVRGFHFSNSFPAVPDINIQTPIGNIGIGDASQGLCGGMVFAIRDCFENRIPVPSDLTAPSTGPLFDFIVLRLIESFNLSLPPPPPPPPFIAPTPPFGPGPATYVYLMNPELSDHETVASNAGLAPHGTSWIMINDQWPNIKQMIDSGHPAPLALIEVRSTDPTLMGDNHQVLAYGYDLNGTDLKIYLYDPNFPDDDNVTMSLSLADPQHTTPVTYSTGETTIWCFFLVHYLPTLPPLQDASRIGVAANDGRILVKEGPLDAAWVPENENCRQVALAGDRIGVLMNDGRVFVKEGSLDAQWVLERENCREVVLAGARIGVLMNDGRVFVKEGPLDTAWVLENENCRQVALAGDRIGVLANDGNLFVKEGSLDAAWVLESSEVESFTLEALSRTAVNPI